MIEYLQAVDYLRQPKPGLTLEDLPGVLGRKWRVKLWTLYKLIKLFLYIYPSQEQLVYKPLSSHSKRLQSYLPEGSQTQPQLSAVLKDLCALSVLVKVSSEYHYSSDHKCYCYFLDRPRAEDFVKIVKPLLPPKHKKVTCDYKDFLSLQEPLEDAVDTELSLCITSKTKLNLSDAEALKGLLNQYSYLASFFSLAQSINEQIQELNWSLYGLISYYPKVTRSKSGTITKLSLRATSPLCNKPKRVNSPEFAETRETILDDVFGSENWQEVDIKSSILKVTYLLNFGQWLDQDRDLYKDIFGDRQDFDENRQFYKSFFMFLYFAQSKQDALRLIKSNYPNYTKADLDYDKMLTVLGKSFKSEIFLHESNILLLLRQKLLKLGIQTLQVYDAVFTSKQVDSLKVYQLLEQSALDYLAIVKSES